MAITNGSNGNDTLFATTGSDTVNGGLGNDEIYGSPEVGGNDRDTLFGGAGNDRVAGRAGDDLVYGDDPTAPAPGGNDTVYGGGGVDTLYGGFGNDILGGDNKVDTLYGGDGDDRIRGERGKDLMYGGGGNDTFVVRTADDSNNKWGVEKIYDFDTNGNDRIDLSYVDANGTINGDQKFAFVGTAAFSAAGQVRYETNATTGTVTVYANIDADVTTSEVIITLLNAAADPVTASDFLL